MRKHLLFFFATLLFVNCLQAQSPTIASFSPSSGPVGSLVTITGTNLSNPTALTIGGVSALPISNTGTSLVAMVMPGVATGSIIITTANGNTASVGNFTVVSSQPSNTQQGNKLVGSGNIGAAYQGSSTSISADGSTAIVGGYKDNTSQGAIWVYTRTGTTWGQQGSKLVATGALNGQQQGVSVSISADGNTAIVGAANIYSATGTSGAWIFIRQGGVWSQQGNKLDCIGATVYAMQGSSVSMSADGNTVIVGGNNDNLGQGAAWIFARTGSTWSQQGSKLVGTGSEGAAQQGKSVSISADGNTVIVGGFYDNNYTGAIWIFTRTAGIWSQQGNKLVGTGTVGTSGYQGYATGLSADGNTAIVGGYDDNNGKGASWIFKRTGNTWSQEGNKLVGTGSVVDALQGSSVGISADGNTVIIGGPSDNSAWFFRRNNGIWSQQGNKFVGTSSTTYGYQGFSAGISADGNTAIIGGIYDNANQGAAWIFSTASTLPVTITNFKAFQKNTGIQVEWNTQNETNLNSYEVEKSTDGSNFSKAGTVMAIGLSSYNWFDANPINGNNYYRLKIMDKDGSSKYSSTVNVKIGGSKNVFTIAGNPIKNNTLVLQMENVEKGNYTISIYNNLGQQVIGKTIVHEGGSATQTIALNNFAAGGYHLIIIGNHQKIHKTVLVE